MSVEDAFKVLISGGIVNPNPSLTPPAQIPPTNNKMPKLQLEEEKLQPVPVEED